MRGSSTSHRQRVMVRVRIGITMFLLALLIMVTLGWKWTARHQPPRLRTASHTVLGLAGIAGIFGLVKIWRRDNAPVSSPRP
jgi:tellurite resistance protein TehA-like permease